MYRSTIIAWGMFIAAILNIGLIANAATSASPSRVVLTIGLILSGCLAAGTFWIARVTDRTQALTNRTKADLAISDARLSEQSQAIDFFADGLDLGIFICDLTATVGYCNRTAREMFSFQNPVGRSIMAITLSYDLEQLVLKAANTQEPQAQEIHFSGETERIAMVKAWFNHRAHQTFISVLDVTNLRRLERVRQDFVANVSHELRTPMAIIRAYAETLLDDADPEAAELQDYLPKMIKEIDRLSGLTKDLLILSAAELEQVQKQCCNFGATVGAVVHQLSQKAEDKGLTLSFTGPEDLYVEANSSQMTQVVLNLVDNAINYTMRGSVDVSLEGEEHRVILTVRDTGIGIASEHSSRIFERFYRVDKGRSRSTGGTGLGLSIVKHIVEAHNGSVAVKSIIQLGSEFTVVLPVGQVESQFEPSI